MIELQLLEIGRVKRTEYWPGGNRTDVGVGLGFSGQGIINRARLYSFLVFIVVFLYIFYFGADEPLFLGLEAPRPKKKCGRFLLSFPTKSSRQYLYFD